MFRRSGDEPVTARSALRLRLGLSVWGLLWAAFGTVLFAVLDHPGWAVAFGVLWLVMAVDLVQVIRHLRQGSRYQPGPEVPPFPSRRR